MVYVGVLLKIPPNWRFHTFFNDLTPFFHTFFKILFDHIIRLLNCYKNIYGLHRFSIENSSKLAISHLFWRFYTFLAWGTVIGISLLFFLKVAYYWGEVQSRKKIRKRCEKKVRNRKKRCEIVNFGEFQIENLFNPYIFL